MRRFLLAPALAILLAAPCFSAETSAGAAGGSAGQSQATASPARLKAAEELLHFMNIESQLNSTVTAMVDTMTQSQPKLVPYRDVLADWAGSFMTWKTFGPRMTAIYAEAFSESELHDLLTFYRSPTGQKALSTMPALMQRGMQLGVEIAREHGSELEERLRARAAELAVPPKPGEPAAPAAPAAPSKH